jgi:colanic acid/amylovoran biosynthesis glycosyltransferase
MILGYLTNQYASASDTFIRQEVRHLRALGHTVHTFSTRRPPPDHNVSEEVRSEQASTTYILDAGAMSLLWACVVCAAASPVRTLRAAALAWGTRSPGVKALLWQLIYLVEAAYLARRLRRQRVEHLHNHIAMNSANVAMLAAVIADVTWSMTVHGPHDFVEPLRWALPRKLAHAAFSVFIADYGKSQGMLHSDPAVWPRLHVVRCGLDGAFLGRAPTPPPSEPRLVFVGRLAPEKGVLVLLDALVRLRERGVRCELTVIGDGPSRGDIDAAVARHGLGDAVTMLGWQGSDRVRDEILRSRALVLPSFAEGLPIVIMESLALHRPVISTYVAGIPELVEPGVCGLLTPPGSVDELTDAIAAIVSASPDKLRQWGEAGAQRVQQRHDAAVNARQLEALFSRTTRETR